MTLRPDLDYASVGSDIIVIFQGRLAHCQRPFFHGIHNRKRRKEEFEMNHNNGKTFVLVKCALLAALAVALNFVKFAPWPNGGSITAAAMAPIVLAGLMFGPGWGALTGFTFSLLQMLLDGISAPPVETVLWYILVILLDYVIAYTVLGLAGIIAKPFLKPVKGAVVGTLAVTAVRYLCDIASGILIWGVYAPEGTPVWLYSLLYNGSYMVPEMIITTIVVGLLAGAVFKKTHAA